MHYLTVSNEQRKVLFMVPILLILLGCTRNVPSIGNVRVEDIQENPAAYLGKTVTVSGEIEKVYGPRAFQLGGRDFFNSEIRVITAQPLKEGVRRRADAPFMPDDIALVTGTVRNVVIADVEREFSFDLDPNYEVEFESKPAIIASSVLISPRGQGADSATASGRQDVITQLEAILDASDKTSWIGRNIELNQVDVQSLVGDSSFWIGTGSDRRIMVTFAEMPTPGRNQEGQIAIKPGQKVALTGVIQRMPEPAEGWLKQNNIDSKTAEALRQSPIYIQARSLRIVNSAG